MSDVHISAVVLTHNSQLTIKKCLDSLLWCDEICIVDDDSADQTLEIASSLGAKVFHRKLNDNFSGQRNYALTIVRNDWVLFVDADEIIPKELREEIESVILKPAFQAYSIPRTTFVNGNRLRFGEFLRFAIVRFGKKTAGLWKGKIHETWEIKEEVGVLSSPIFHDQVGGIGNALLKINLYSKIRAKELKEQNVSSTFFTILTYPMGKFLVNYIFRLGFLDGTAGMVSAIMMSFYTFLVRGKLWFLWHERTKSP